jgi:hypothetical protein
MDYEELVKDHAGELVEKLVRDVVSKDAVEIRFEFEDDNQWSVVSMHIYEEDKEISLRLHADDLYELHFGYYDDDDEFFEIMQALTPEEKEIIPVNLRKLMKKVLADEKGMRVSGKLIAKA